jgi:uncharacterized integral membrane protein
MSSNQNTTASQFELFKYFEDRAEKLKSQVITLTIFICGFLSAILGFAVDNLSWKNCSITIANRFQMLSAAISGIILCLLALLIIKENAQHINRNFNRGKFARSNPDCNLEECWNAGGAGCSQRFPPVCINLQYLVILFAALFFLLFALSVSA